MDNLSEIPNILVVGAAGSGKSSLIRLLLGKYSIGESQGYLLHTGLMGQNNRLSRLLECPPSRDSVEEYKMEFHAAISAQVPTPPGPTDVLAVVKINAVGNGGFQMARQTNLPLIELEAALSIFDRSRIGTSISVVVTNWSRQFARVNDRKLKGVTEETVSRKLRQEFSEQFGLTSVPCYFVDSVFWRTEQRSPVKFPGQPLTSLQSTYSVAGRILGEPYDPTSDNSGPDISQKPPDSRYESDSSNISEIDRRNRSMERRRATRKSPGYHTAGSVSTSVPIDVDVEMKDHPTAQTTYVPIVQTGRKKSNSSLKDFGKNAVGTSSKIWEEDRNSDVSITMNSGKVDLTNYVEGKVREMMEKEGVVLDFKDTKLKGRIVTKTKIIKEVVGKDGITEIVEDEEIDESMFGPELQDVSRISETDIQKDIMENSVPIYNLGSPVISSTFDRRSLTKPDTAYQDNKTRYDTTCVDNRTRSNTMYADSNTSYDKTYVGNTTRTDNMYVDNKTRYDKAYVDNKKRPDSMYEDSKTRYDKAYVDNNTRPDSIFVDNQRRSRTTYVDNTTESNTIHSDINRGSSTTYTDNIARSDTTYVDYSLRPDTNHVNNTRQPNTITTSRIYQSRFDNVDKLSSDDKISPDRESQGHDPYFERPGNETRPDSSSVNDYRRNEKVSGSNVNISQNGFDNISENQLSKSRSNLSRHDIMHVDSPTSVEESDASEIIVAEVTNHGQQQLLRNERVSTQEDVSNVLNEAFDQQLQVEDDDKSNNHYLDSTVVVLGSEGTVKDVTSSMMDIRGGPILSCQVSESAESWQYSRLGGQLKTGSGVTFVWVIESEIEDKMVSMVKQFLKVFGPSAIKCMVVVVRKPDQVHKIYEKLEDLKERVRTSYRLPENSLGIPVIEFKEEKSFKAELVSSLSEINQLRVTDKLLENLQGVPDEDVEADRKDDLETTHVVRDPVVLVTGPPGHGRSSVANLILGKNQFQVRGISMGGRSQNQVSNIVLDSGVKVTVGEGPGLCVDNPEIEVTVPELDKLGYLTHVVVTWYILELKTEDLDFVLSRLAKVFGVARLLPHLVFAVTFCDTGSKAKKYRAKRGISLESVSSMIKEKVSQFFGESGDSPAIYFLSSKSERDPSRQFLVKYLTSGDWPTLTLNRDIAENMDDTYENVDSPVEEVGIDVGRTTSLHNLSLQPEIRPTRQNGDEKNLNTPEKKETYSLARPKSKTKKKLLKTRSNLNLARSNIDLASSNLALQESRSRSNLYDESPSRGVRQSSQESPNRTYQSQGRLDDIRVTEVEQIDNVSPRKEERSGSQSRPGGMFQKRGGRSRSVDRGQGGTRGRGRGRGVSTLGRQRGRGNVINKGGQEDRRTSTVGDRRTSMGGGRKPLPLRRGRQGSSLPRAGGQQRQGASLPRAGGQQRQGMRRSQSAWSVKSAPGKRRPNNGDCVLL